MQTTVKAGAKVQSATAIGRNSSSGQQADARPQPRRTEWFWCALVAFCATAWSLRTNGPYNVIETDAARHAMNGVFLRDWILSGQWTSVLSYAREYYAHLPVLSMPYHPPLFPAIEAIFFAVFGVNALAARLAVAMFVGASSVLLFRLILAGFGSVALAVAGSVTFLCLPEALWVGADVLLEFPAMAFTLAAIYCLRGADTDFSMRRALVYALLSSAALWTRQQTFFLAVLPIGYFLLMGRWRVLRSAPLWLSVALIGAAVAGVSALSVPFHGAGVNHAIPTAAGADRIDASYAALFIRNLKYYSGAYPKAAGITALILLAAALLALALGLYSRKTVALYGSWIVASLGVILLIRPITTRYLFYTYPALIIFGYAGLYHLVERFTDKRRWTAAAVLGVTCIALVQFPYRTQYLHGPDEAARILAGTDATRIMYCGGTDGNFMFNYRVLRDDMRAAILPGDKLPPRMFTPAGVEEFAHDYGIQYIVVEDASASGLKLPWSGLISKPAPSMVAERDIPISSSGRWNGRLRIFRFTNPSPTPKSFVALRMRVIGGIMDFSLRK
jgi:4-amino-4-deoxy-L-arabinose transferase-like glycosyltransferase